MAVKIYKYGTFDHVDFICDDSLDLSSQIYYLEKWLKTKGVLLPKSRYVADIGFDVNRDASGGGAVLNSKTIKMLNDIGMEVYFSEYPKPSFLRGLICSAKGFWHRLRWKYKQG